MNILSLEKWIQRPEDDHHDFKEHWYHKGNKLELIKDVLSFANTVHHDDCYLIIGVNDSRNVTGVENDGDERLNQQKLIDFIRSLPISGEFIPQLKVETIQVDAHEVDVITIVNTFNVPIFLGQGWHERGTTHKSIYPGQIFTREQDVNTARNSTADYHQVQNLWRKHFRMDLSIEEKYKFVLSDIEHWSYTEFDNYVFSYNFDPDYYMIFSEDSENRYVVESYSIDQLKKKIGWQLLKLKFRQTVINEFLVVTMDGGRFFSVAPNISSLDTNLSSSKSYNYLIKDSFEWKVQSLLQSDIITNEDSAEMGLNSFFNSVVVFESNTEKEILNKVLKERLEEIEKLINPSITSIKQLQKSLKLELYDNNNEIQFENLKYIIRQNNCSHLVNNALNYFRIHQSLPDKLNF